jgi:hypothetical protein
VQHKGPYFLQLFLVRSTNRSLRSTQGQTSQGSLFAIKASEII